MRLILSLFSLTMIGGVAAAEPHRGESRSGRVHAQQSSYAHAQRPHSDHRGTRAQPRHDDDDYQTTRRSHVVNGRGGHRQMLVQRHYDHGHRPAPMREHHAHVDGHVWVPGQWAWNGYEWIWQAGRYDVDPAYGSSGAGVYYDSGY